MRKLIVNEKYNNKKLNNFILDSFPNLNKNTLFKALRKKDIRINGKRVSEDVTIYTGDEILDFSLLGAICKEVKLPLVLHGASGLDENKLKTAIFCGVAKININTDLQIAWSNAVRSYLDYDKEAYDPRKIIMSGEKEIKKIIHEKNNILGCKNKI